MFSFFAKDTKKISRRNLVKQYNELMQKLHHIRYKPYTKLNFAVKQQLEVELDTVLILLDLPSLECNSNPHDWKLGVVLDLGSSCNKKVLSTIQTRYQGCDDISVETITEKERRLLINTFLPINYSTLFITEDFLVNSLLNYDTN